MESSGGADKFGSYLLELISPLRELLIRSALVFAAAIFAWLFLLFLQSFYRTRLLAAAAAGGQKKKMSKAAIFSAVVEAGGKAVHTVCISFPTFLGIFLVVFSVFTISTTISGIYDITARIQRIRELSVAIKYLEQSDKVIDVRVLSVENGFTTLRLDYSAKDSGDGSVPSTEWRKEISIQGTDIFFDCMVLNFSYSEITSGRQKNIAIPYRVFSEVVPAVQGIALHDMAYNIPDEDEYGFIPPVYRERLKQLLEDEGFRKELGVRSVNGSAPHRYVSGGDKFTVKIENVGGINIY